jgi:hypothetical protein
MSDKNLNLIFKDLFKSLGKTLTKSGYLEFKLTAPQEAKIVLTTGSVILSGFDEITGTSLSGLSVVRFNLPDFVSIISLVDKKDEFELESMSDTFFQVSGLPIFALPVEEDEVVIDAINKIELSNSDLKSLIKILKIEKKKLKKSFLTESELLIVSLVDKSVTVIGELDYSTVNFGEKKGNVGANNFIISLNKNDEKIVESLFSKSTDAVTVIETKSNFRIISETKEAVLEKRTINLELYNKIVG